MIPITDEQAKLGQEAARTTASIVTLLGDAGRALGKSQLATIASDVIGYWLGGDKLHDKRLLNLGLTAARRDRLFESIADKSRITEPSPSLLLPLLEAAMDESRAELQDLWARLLANAMIDGGSKVRRDFFTTLKGLEPLDVAVLNLFDHAQIRTPRNEQLSEMARVLREGQVAGFTDDLLTVSLQALADRGCIRPQNFGYLLTPYGRAFVAACRVE